MDNSMDKAALQAKFAEYELSGYFHSVQQHLRNAIALDLDENKPVAAQPGNSRIGGLPDLPAGIAWPRRAGQPLAFIAQINFSQARPFDLDGKLPDAGMLYLFYDVTEMPWGFDPKDADGKQVLFHGGGGALQPAARPGDLDPDHLFSPAGLSFSARANVPDQDSSLVDYAMEDDEHDNYLDLKEDTAFQGSGHKLLGHSGNIQSGQELQCELVTNGLYCGNASGYQDPRRFELEKNIHHWRLLLQIDSNDECAMTWGDLGRLYLWIKDEDLQARRFDRTWLILQCH